MPEEVLGDWIRRYGADAEKVVALWLEDEDARVIVGPRHLTVAEIRYAIREKMSSSLEDLLVRRTPIFFYDAEGGLEVIDAITAVFLKELGWSRKRVDHEISSYRELVRAHRPGGFDQE